MTEPLDLAAIRAQGLKWAECFSFDGNGKTILALCDELERLRAENARLGDDLERERVRLAGCSVAALGGTKDPATREMYGWSPAYQDTLDLRRQADAMRPVIEAARAWVAWGLRRKGSELLQDNNLATAMRVANDLEAAVAAYEAQQGEKHSDQRTFCEECGAYTDALGFAIPWAANDIISERDAEIARLTAEAYRNWQCYTDAEGRATRAELNNARLRAELNAAGDALEQARIAIAMVRLDSSSPVVDIAGARDRARRAAAKEGL